ncbi:MAG: iron-sulfur cluster assembly scaffold protein [Pseudomonadota bacterium]
MINEIYNSKLLALAGNIPRNGRLQRPDATGTARSKLCGSELTVDIKTDDTGQITDYAHEVKACALGQAAASVVASQIIGASRQEVERAYGQMAAMLKQGGKPPDGRFVDLKYLEPVKDYPARQASTMLVLSALVDAFAQLDERAAAG